jgi:hypothetical protein
VEQNMSRHQAAQSKDQALREAEREAYYFRNLMRETEGNRVILHVGGTGRHRMRTSYPWFTHEHGKWVEA